MSILLSLRSELVKTKRTSAWYLCLLCTVFTPLYAYLLFTEPDKINGMKADPWNSFLVGEPGLVFNLVILPFFLFLICTLQAQLEFRNNTWKQVFVSPQPLLNVFLSKFLNIQLLLIAVFILTNILLVLLLICIHYFQFRVNLSKSLDWEVYLINNGRIYISVMAISAIQFWLGLRFKNFIVPIGIGLCCWIAAINLVEGHPWVHDNKFPYIYPMRNYFPKNASDKATVLWGSLAYTGLFLTLGFIDFRRKRSK